MVLLILLPVFAHGSISGWVHPWTDWVPLRPDHGLLQGGPGHLYLLKNKVATFAKVEKEEDMIQ